MSTKKGRSPKSVLPTVISLMIVMLTALSACIPPLATPTAAPALTNTPQPTNTPVPSPTLAPTLQPGDTTYSITVNGIERSYILHIPPGVNASQPLPIIFALPAYDIEVFFAVTDLISISGFNAIADQDGFLMVYPSGVSGTWNAGSCCGAAVDQKIDETAFFRQMLTDIGKIATVDPKRIYAVGFQIGGMMTFRLGCEMSDTFAGIASVAGSQTFSPCEPSQPVSIIQIHGMKDLLVPYAGGVGGFMGGKTTFPAVQDTITSWAQLDGCTGTPQVEKQGAIGTRTIYSSCKDGSGIELYVIDGLGNNWPSQYVLPAAQIIWDFFKAHPKP